MEKVRIPKVEGLALSDINTFSKVIIIKNGTGARIENQWGKTEAIQRWSHVCIHGHWGESGESTHFSIKSAGIIGDLQKQFNNCLREIMFKKKHQLEKCKKMNLKSFPIPNRITYKGKGYQNGMRLLNSSMTSVSLQKRVFKSQRENNLQLKTMPSSDLSQVWRAEQQTL